MFKPLGTRVLVKLIARETQTASGLHLPGGADGSPTGSVVAVGPKTDQVVVGDKVIFGTLGASEVPSEPGCLLVPEENILAVVND